IAALLVVGGGASWMANQPHGAPENPTGLAAGTPSAFQNERNASSDAKPALLVQMVYIAPENAAAALRGAGYTPDEQTRIMAAIKRREYRLAVMPVFDATNTGGTILIQSGVMKKIVHLTPQPQNVILPITLAGEVTITPVSAPGPTGITPGAITVLGPEIFPALQTGDSLLLSVMVQ
ncbi:hypothetical protein, partial [Acetobacter sp.]|uniref:hypothetical protein n=1 Tax=Acetobacter sp. TaxID=440 RepID=UPI0039E81728